MVEKINNNRVGPFLTVTMPDGSKQNYSVAEPNARGMNFVNVNNDNQFYTYKGENGLDLFTQDIADLPTSITINPDTGNIKLLLLKL